MSTNPSTKVSAFVSAGMIASFPDRNELMAETRDRLQADLKAAVEARGGEYVYGRQHLMASENKAGVTLYASHP